MGLEEIDDGLWTVYFDPLILGRFHERHMRIEDEHGRLNPTRCNPCPRTFLFLCPRLLKIPATVPALEWHSAHKNAR